MQRFLGFIRPYVGSRSFYKGALSVMLPVTVQQLVNNLFNVVDNLMVGSLDIQGLAMSAVSVANKPIVIFNGLLFGLAGAGGLLISQYFGAHDRKACTGLFWLQMSLSLLCATLFFVLLFCFPDAIMRIFVTDPRTVGLGVEFMRIIGISYFPVAVSSVCVFSMRSLGQNRASMLVSLVSMGVNALCNYALIFGNFGLPRLGVAGAAYGTLIARLFEMTFYLTLLFRNRMYFACEPFSFVTMDASIRRKFSAKARPLIANELLYCVGLNIFFWCYARIDESSLSALTIAELCYQISMVIITGSSSAISVMIGTALGAGELDKARSSTKKLALLTLYISIASTLLCCVLAFLLPQLYNVSNSLRATATQIASTMAVFMPFGFLYAFCFFCLRAGGDTRHATLLDSGFMWALPVPASILMALFLPGKTSILFAVLVVQVLTSARILPALHVLRKGRWIRNITMDEQT